MEKHEIIGDVRGMGAMLAIEFTKPGTLEHDAALTQLVAEGVNMAVGLFFVVRTLAGRREGRA